MVCVLNCCKIIHNLLSTHTDKAGADEFFPVLVYVTLKARAAPADAADEAGRPPCLYSNVEFIRRFRNPLKLNSGEAGYYFTNLEGALSFIETLDGSRLSMDTNEFDAKVTAAVEVLAVKREREGVGIDPERLGAPVASAAPVWGGSAAPVVGDATAKLLLGDFFTAPQPAPAAGGSMPGGALGGLKANILNPMYDAVVGKPAMPAASRPAQAVGGGDIASLPLPALPRSSDVPTGDLLGGMGLSGDASAPAPARGSIDAQELFAALSEPAVGEQSPAVAADARRPTAQPAAGKFEGCTVEDLAMRDVPLLLADYKRLAALVRKTRVFLEGQGFSASSSGLLG